MEEGRDVEYGGGRMCVCVWRDGKGLCHEQMLKQASTLLAVETSVRMGILSFWDSISLVSPVKFILTSWGFLVGGCGAALAGMSDLWLVTRFGPVEAAGKVAAAAAGTVLGCSAAEG